MHQDALHLPGGVPLPQIRPQRRQQPVIGRRSGQRKIDAVFRHGHTGGHHHELVAAVQALQQFAVIQKGTFVQIAGVGVNEIPAIGIGAADDVLDGQIPVDGADGVLRKEPLQPVMVKKPRQLVEIPVGHPVHPHPVVAHQLPDAAGLPQLLQVGVHLFGDVFAGQRHVGGRGGGSVQILL